MHRFEAAAIEITGLSLKEQKPRMSPTVDVIADATGVLRLNVNRDGSWVARLEISAVGNQIVLDLWRDDLSSPQHEKRIVLFEETNSKHTAGERHETKPFPLHLQP